MSAEVLRRAAALMRERAEAATDGGHGWRSTGEERLCEVWAPRDAANYDAFLVASTLTRLNPNPSTSAQANADHIASWHPAVALAVAKVLEERAAAYEQWSRRGRGEARIILEEFTAAFAVARAYLGEQP